MMAPQIYHRALLTLAPYEATLGQLGTMMEGLYGAGRVLEGLAQRQQRRVAWRDWHARLHRGPVGSLEL